VEKELNVNLLWDAGRKSLYLIEDAIREGLLEGKGWRKGKYWRRELKKLMRISAKTLFGGGRNKELLKLYISEVIMPKKGRKNQAEQAEESGKTFQKLRHRH